MLTCTAHICLLYKGTDVYSFMMKYNIIHLAFLTLVHLICTAQTHIKNENLKKGRNWDSQPQPSTLFLDCRVVSQLRSIGILNNNKIISLSNIDCTNTKCIKIWYAYMPWTCWSGLMYFLGQTFSGTKCIKIWYLGQTMILTCWSGLMYFLNLHKDVLLQLIT